MNALSDRLFRRKVRQGQYDWVLATSPDFAANFLNERPRARVLMVVHDLMHSVTAPDGLYDAAGPGLTALLYLASRATKIVCISRATQNALLRHGMVNPARTLVIQTANLLAARSVRAAECKLPAHYLLFVGERSGRKGFYSSIAALRPLFDTHPDLQLICTGTLRHVEVDYLRQQGVADRVTAMPADDPTLVALYRNAICLLYPSLYEGFGLPVVEAMHLGCPVITTRLGALAEVAGDAAHFVNPFKEGELVSAVQKILQDAEYRQSLIARGKQQASRFEAETMFACFQEALQSDDVGRNA